MDFSFLFSLQTNCGVANLVDRYLGHLYPEYQEHTRPVLIRQARDLLVCTFHGDLTKFEEDFLSPAANIIDEAKRSCCTSETVSAETDFLFLNFAYKTPLIENLKQNLFLSNFRL